MAGQVSTVYAMWVATMIRRNMDMKSGSSEVATDGVPRRLYTVAETATALAISRSKVYDLIHGGRLASVKIDGARRVSDTSIDEFIEGLKGGIDR
jgi:excisionase family DNA binding protein